MEEKACLLNGCERIQIDEGYGGKPEFLREVASRVQDLRGRSPHDVYRLESASRG